ncbi:bifunctional 2',3'-cyclic-nucleotide 2'-phosphodiesterase/3'-nucleotidase [Paenibacillus methanolicus]|uniref:2',3'-cyclic-nucleotide 2'-phosphodiesterase/3'-nucleotidase/5'-nucleotidase n=1 Tax=Paenibacillus methanolicus TaxID=582686 RepID=A0A5S5BSV3_9BACL|nr:bifunctional 2',3'-cyclic-nucleotide 2'-phosphodiesterase/3'-nucleotidase [Paenibacillus methanolicus]TYP68653.1 2',3'-cyclic-nucleotide 2'-phosphodiesterase/3'-nucleotidase/5'-nucleotidase [Paenibacillus methanolicus]
MRLIQKRMTRSAVAASLLAGFLASPYVTTPVRAQTALELGAAEPAAGASTGEATAAAENGADLVVRIMETTDVHTNFMNYDYYKDAAVETVGIVKTAELVKQARAEVKNALLVDNGDLLQGTPLGTYMAKVKPLVDGQVHPAYKAMNIMGYDIATFGNHEFNYGLTYLDEAIDDAAFPYVNANVYVDDHDNNPDNDQNQYQPYKILEKTFTDENGQSQTVKIGFLGLVTPQIMDWDKAHLEGKVIAKDIVATAQKFVPQMKAEGADIIVALTHSGFNKAATAGSGAEDAIYPLSEVDGIDAITFSHTHKVFPAASVTALDALFKDASGNPLPGVDNAKGTINGVAAVQAGFGGANLGIIDLTLTKQDGKWVVKNSQSSTKAIYDSVNKKPLVDADPAIVEAIKDEHAATKVYANQAIGTTTAPIYSYFALVQDDPSVQIVTAAQKWYVQKVLNEKNSPDKNLPILSVGAPFKAGRNGPAEYTDIKQGGLAIKSASDLYLYDNTLKAVKVKGSVVKEWLEMSAGMFNQIDTSKTSDQALLNSSFPVYNFDVIDGVTYQVDVTKPAKYKTDGTVNDATSSRIVNLQFDGKAIDPNQEFIVVSNNYRVSGGGNFPGVKGSTLVVDSADENRQVLMDYITEQKTINPSADKNWSIAPIAADVNVTFTSSPSAKEYLAANPNITATEQTDAKGFQVYKLDMKAQNVKVKLLGINDFHGQLDYSTKVGESMVGGAAYLATYLKKLEQTNPNTLLVHNGDAVGASSPVSALDRDKPTLDFLKLLDFDVASLGNHEFDQGVPALLAQLNGGVDPVNTKITHEKTDIEYVSANVIVKETGKPLIAPYVVKEIGGEKIGFIGVVTMLTPSKVSPAALEPVNIVAQAPVVNKAVAELKEQGVKAIVVLAHDPASQNSTTGAITGEAADLANAVDDEVDVIFAGDNHAKVNGSVDNKLVFQAYSYGTAFADVNLEIDPKTHDIVKKEATIVDVKQEGVTPDAASNAIIQASLERHPELSQPVGSADKAYAKANAYTQETELGNLIADAMRDSMSTDFAFMNPGGIRADLPKGDVKYSDLFRIQPFGNQLVKMTLTGAQVKKLLQQQWGAADSDTKTLQISGLKYTADFNKPIADRVVSLAKEDGTPITDTAEYTVVVNNFMAAGGDNYKVLLEGKNPAAGSTDIDALYNYVLKIFKKGTITASLKGRITNIAKTTPTPSTPYVPSAPAPSTPTNAGAGKVEFKLTDIAAPVNGIAALDASKASIADAQIVLPIGATQTVGSNALAIKLSSGTVTIPSEVLSALSTLAGSDAKASITLGVSQLSDSEAAAAIAKAKDPGAQMAPQGQVLELTLGVMLADGKTKPLSAFAKPITLQLQLAAGADVGLSGIYYIADNGTVEYIGGTVQGTTITAEVSHFSQYGVFSYAKNYADLPAAHWASRAVQELTAKHVVEGVAADKFGPNAAVTRAEFLTMVVRQFGLEASGPSPFSDIQTGSWYADAVSAAYANGMVEGTGTGKFEPNKTITREEMAVLIARVHEKQGGQATGGQAQASGFADATSISKWALEDVDAAVKSGLMNGSKDGRFAPLNKASRAEAAQVLYNLLHKTQA